MLTILTIAGFDPSSGAGITADLATIAAHDCFGIACITALTVQSTCGVDAVYPVDSAVVRATLEVLVKDLPPRAVKIGMLATEANVLAVASFLDVLRGWGIKVPVVLDPVCRASSGLPLLDDRGLSAMRAHLLPLVSWITPNRPELALLSGLPTEDEEAVERSAHRLAGERPNLSIVATGGDGERADDFVLSAGSGGEWMRAEKLVSEATHGTGCAFSTALACQLARGATDLRAVRQSKEYVTEAIRRANPLGRGKGPMNLRWRLER